MKRSHLKRFSAGMVYTPRRPNILMLKEIKERVLTQAGGLPVLDNTFMRNIPARKGRLNGHMEFRVYRDDKDVRGKELEPDDPLAATKADKAQFHPHPLRVRIDRLHKLWQQEESQQHDHFLTRKSNQQGIDTYHSITWMECGDHTLKLFFCGNRYCWVEERETYARVSCTYAGKASAVAALTRYSKIIWVKTVKPEEL